MANYTLNCSRIGVTGGLRSFADQVMAGLADPANPVEAVLPERVPAPLGILKIATPQSLGSTSTASLVRPLLWLAYSRYNFPAPIDRRILCTTHHVLPRHKHQIVTVHDLRPYFYPDTPLQRFYFHRMLPRALKRCEGVLTVSEASRALIMEVYKLPGSSVRVVPNAVKCNTRMDLPPHSSQLGAQGEPYLLMVGASMRHKNAEEVLHMHLHWASRWRLKIVAGAGGHRGRLEKLAAQLNIAHRVDFLTRVDETELQSLYAHCVALVYPSTMEGFGLPPLEALAHGRPVIVSDIPVFREIYADCASFVTLGNEESWEAVFQQLGEPTPQQVASGIARVNSFSSSRQATALHEALDHFWGWSSAP